MRKLRLRFLKKDEKLCVAEGEEEERDAQINYCGFCPKMANLNIKSLRVIIEVVWEQ